MKFYVVCGLILTIAGFMIHQEHKEETRFYPLIQKIQENNLSLWCSTLIWAVLFLLIGKICIWAFFSELREIELENVFDNTKFALFDFLLSMTMFTSELSPSFVLIVIGLLGIKSLHWIARDRIDFMESGARPTGLTLLRVYSSVLTCCSIDMLGVLVSSLIYMDNGPPMSLHFVNEFVLALVHACGSHWKFWIQIYDLWREDEWIDKGKWILYLDLFISSLSLTAHSTFFIILFALYTLPLHLARGLITSYRIWIGKVKDALRLRKLSVSRFPIPTREEILASDPTCMVCREDMNDEETLQALSTGIVRRLPCGHVFHSTCIQTWLYRQAHCPTCRRDLLAPVTPTPTPSPPPRADLRPNVDAAAPQPQQPGPVPPAGHVPMADRDDYPGRAWRRTRPAPATATALTDVSGQNAPQSSLEKLWTQQFSTQLQLFMQQTDLDSAPKLRVLREHLDSVTNTVRQLAPEAPNTTTPIHTATPVATTTVARSTPVDQAPPSSPSPAAPTSGRKLKGRPTPQHRVQQYLAQRPTTSPSSHPVNALRQTAPNSADSYLCPTPSSSSPSPSTLNPTPNPPPTNTTLTLENVRERRLRALGSSQEEIPQTS